MSLTLQQQTNIARSLAPVFFGNTVAAQTHADILTAVQGVDAALDLTLTQAASAVGGGTTIINGLAMSVTAPVAGSWSNGQKAIMVSYVLEARAGLI